MDCTRRLGALEESEGLPLVALEIKPTPEEMGRVVQTLLPVVEEVLLALRRMATTPLALHVVPPRTASLGLAGTEGTAAPESVDLTLAVAVEADGTPKPGWVAQARLRLRRTFGFPRLVGQQAQLADRDRLALLAKLDILE